MPVFNPDAPNVYRPDSRQLEDLIDEAEEVLAILRYGHEPTTDNPVRVIPLAELIEQVRLRRTYTGLPPSTRPTEPRGSVLDDQGVPMPPGSDAVGELVATAHSDEIGDETRALLAIVTRGLRDCVGALRSAHGALAKATPALTSTSEGDPGCKVHANYGVWEPVYRNERCRWDYDFWLAEGVDTPEPIMKARLRGDKITDQMVKLALNPPEPKRKRHLRRRR